MIDHLNLFIIKRKKFLETLKSKEKEQEWLNLRKCYFYETANTDTQTFRIATKSRKHCFASPYKKNVFVVKRMPEPQRQEFYVSVEML
jgi:hypothetical protein